MIRKYGEKTNAQNRLMLFWETVLEEISCQGIMKKFIETCFIQKKGKDIRELYNYTFLSCKSPGKLLAISINIKSIELRKKQNP